MGSPVSLLNGELIFSVENTFHLCARSGNTQRKKQTLNDQVSDAYVHVIGNQWYTCTHACAHTYTL